MATMSAIPDSVPVAMVPYINSFETNASPRMENNPNPSKPKKVAMSRKINVIIEIAVITASFFGFMILTSDIGLSNGIINCYI